ncbi:MAG: acyltransferase family protein [Gammaproteobacteria bacterium]
MKHYKSRWIEYRPEIDGLRAIAVIAVVLYHADLGLGAGYVGVDIFFVISGYLITSLIYREWSVTGRINLIDFFARRIRRIIPALIIVVICTVTASMVLLSPYGEKFEFAQSVAASLLFIGNFFFQGKTGGYFDLNAAHMPILHLWSLSVEEQFYAVWPILFLTVLKFQPSFRIVVLGLLVAASFLFAEILLFINPNAAFYQMPARFWELAIGGAISLLPTNQRDDGRKEMIGGAILIIFAISFRITHFPGIGSLPAVVGAMLIIHSIHISSALGPIGFLFRLRPVVLCGLVSYSLYLWHWPLISLYRVSHVGPLSLTARLTLITAAFVLSWLSYRFVEIPCRRPDLRIKNSGLVVSALIMLVSLAYLLMKIGVYFHQQPLPTDLASLSQRDMPRNRTKCHYRGDQGLESFPRSDCISVTDKPIRVAIWGDSHALAWQPMAWLIAQNMKAAAISHTRDACPPVLEYDNGKRFLEAYHCRDFNHKVSKDIKDSKIDTLILTALWPSDLKRNHFKEKFESTLHMMASHVRKILLLGPTPYLNESAPRCIKLNNLDMCAITRNEFEARYGNSKRFLKALAAKYENVEYVELTSFFCDQKTCPVLKNGYALYWDSNHVSSTAARNFTELYIVEKGL